MKKTLKKNKSYLWIYVTHGNKKKALAMSRILIGEKLVACVNLLDKVTSIYLWKGKLVEDKEVILIMKTREKLYQKLRDRISQLHSYSCPCIIALSISKGNKDYLSWISKQTTI